jgi:hypothetical protein
MSKEPGIAEKFFNTFVDENPVSLSGVDWGMVVATLEESADNCFRCKNKGCQVCNITRRIAKRIEEQIL